MTRSVAALTALLVLYPLTALAQSTDAPIRIPVSGTVGATGTVMLHVALYTSQTGGSALLTEDHTVALTATGGYSIVVGSTAAYPEGLPLAVFANSGARWLGISVDTDPEGPRSALITLPYAARAQTAATAETLDGVAPSGFVSNAQLDTSVRDALEDPAVQAGLNGQFAAVSSAVPTTQNALPRFISTDGALGNTNIFSVDDKVGIGTTTPTSALTVAPSAPASGTSTTPFLDVSGVFNQVNTANALGARVVMTSAGSSSYVQTAMQTFLAPGYTGSSNTFTLTSDNYVAGTGTGAWTLTGANMASRATARGSTTGHNVGSNNRAWFSSALNLGTLSQAMWPNGTPALNVASASFALNATTNVAGYFGLRDNAPMLTESAAVIADNGTLAAPIFVGRDDGTEVLRVADGGSLGIGTTTPGYSVDVQGGQINASGGLCINEECKTSWVEAGPWTTASTNIGFATGNVGIGTTSPNHSLHVLRDGNDLMRLQNSSGGDWRFIVGSNEFGLYDNQNSAYSLYVKSGNVGIGTIEPNAKLTVSDGSTLSNTSGVMIHANQTIQTNEATMTAAPILAVNHFNEAGAVVQQWLTPGALANNQASLFGIGNNLALQSRRYNTGGVAAIALNPVGGNVGIGTTTPGALLDVVGEVMNSHHGVQTKLSNDTSTGYVGTGTNHPLSLMTAGAVRMTLTTAGSVGVGTASPGHRLDVQGGSINASGGLCIDNVCKTWAEASPWAISSANIGFATGNVGIGTTTPTAALTVAPTVPATGTSSAPAFMDVTGTFNEVNTAGAVGAEVDITSAGSATAYQMGLVAVLRAGYTGTAHNAAFNASNEAAGTGTSGWLFAGANYGSRGAATGLTTGHNVGAANRARGSATLNIGTLSRAAENNGTPALNVASASLAVNATTNVAGYFGLRNDAPVLTESVALVADNGELSAPIFVGRDNGTEVVRIADGGNVGIGTDAPTAKLHVIGDVVVSGNIGAKYQDVAEWVDSREALEAGTVVTIDPAAVNGVVASAREYDSRVAGAVSAQPGLILGEGGEGRIMVAQSGRVRIKVDASYGAITPGDLLVTSPRAGHAMVSRPVDIGGIQIHRPGTVIGKALEGLAEGQGEVLTLLTLQ